MISYKITNVRVFESARFGKKPLVFKGQEALPGTTLPPSTFIEQSRDEVNTDDFTRYDVKHEYEDKFDFRLNADYHSVLIRVAKIKAYHSASRGLLLLSGRKRDVLSFCAKAADLDGLRLSTVKVDIPKLEKEISNVKMVWGKNKSGGATVQARALSGYNLETSAEYAALKRGSELINISFEFDSEGRRHPVMVTQDGTVVLQGSYGGVSEEIDLVLRMKSELLDRFIAEKA